MAAWKWPAVAATLAAVLVATNPGEGSFEHMAKKHTSSALGGRTGAKPICDTSRVVPHPLTANRKETDFGHVGGRHSIDSFSIRCPRAEFSSKHSENTEQLVRNIWSRGEAISHSGG